MTCVKTQQRIERSNWITRQSVTSVMLRLTGPMLPAIIAVIGLELFDTYLASTLGTEALAALSFTIPVTSGLFALAIGLSIGTVSVLSYSLGKGDHHKSRRLTTDSVIMAIFLALLISIIGLLTIEPLFEYLGVNYALIPDSYHLGPRPDIMPAITEYIQLRYLGFVIMVIPILANSIMRATGDTTFAARLMFLWASFTAILNYLLVTIPETQLGLINIALGHFIADLLFSIISIIVLVKREKLIDFKLPEFAGFIENCRCILIIGMPATGMSLITPIAGAIITSWIAFYGRDAVAAFGVISRIETLVLFVPMALSTSLPIFVGQNFGAGSIKRSLIAIKKSILMTVVIQIVVYTFLIAFAEQIAQSFSQSTSIVETIVWLLWLLPLSYAGKGTCVIVCSSLNALHLPKSALYLTIIRMFLLYIPAAYIGAYMTGINGLFIGLVVANSLIGLIAFIWIKSSFNSLQKEIINVNNISPELSPITS